jgi:serine/threonine-protein kinase
MHVSIPVEPANEESAAFAVGSLVGGKYVVERTLGSGGLGVVVVARHRELGQRVAIKYLREQGRTISAVVERFRREARIAAQICSEHVVRVQDFGEAAGTPFIVMELLEGRDLGHIIVEGGITTRQAVDYVLQACEGLAEIHAIGVTHRDLKPENLFLVQDRVRGSILKIIDFGISKVTPTQTNEEWARVTSEGERFGTPLYMSPEQLGLGGDVDCRTDVWALGVVLFELLAGEVPFHGADAPHLFANILMSPPGRPSATAPGMPAGLEAAILRCLEKNANRRFQNVAELAQRLAPFGSADALERVRRIEITLALAGLDVRSSTTSSVARDLAASSEVAPPSLRPVALPTIIIPRASTRRRRARVLAPLCAAALGLGALVYLSQREERAGAALPPPAALVAAGPVATFLASARPTVTALQTAMVSAITSTATTASQPAAAARAPLRSTRAMDPPATPRTRGITDRRALYGERK